MQAPKPAICGNGHAAMLRTRNVDTSLVKKEKKVVSNTLKPHIDLNSSKTHTS